jgi:hypothetical protein
VIAHVLHGAVLALGAATPEPVGPELREGLDPLDITPGALGFVVIFAVVLVCIPLFRSMTSKLRGVRYRGELEERRRAEEAELERAAPHDVRDDGTDVTRPGPQA